MKCFFLFTIHILLYTLHRYIDKESFTNKQDLVSTLPAQGEGSIKTATKQSKKSYIATSYEEKAILKKS